MRVLLLILITLVVLGSASAARAATEVVDIQVIRDAALEALGLSGTRSRAMVDSALRLQTCTAPLQATPTGPRTVEVRCTDAPGWRLFVPVRVVREAEVVVLTRPVSAGTTITADDVEVRRQRVHGGAAYAEPSTVIGMTATQGLASGAALGDNVLSTGPLLQRGDPVILVSRAGGIEVRMAGRSLGRAAPGDTVSVENLGSRRIVRGRLIGEGTVEVGS